jgi:autotransporter-associated beta strand protein
VTIDIHPASSAASDQIWASAITFQAGGVKLAPYSSGDALSIPDTANGGTAITVPQSSIDTITCPVAPASGATNSELDATGGGTLVIDGTGSASVGTIVVGATSGDNSTLTVNGHLTVTSATGLEVLNQATLAGSGTISVGTNSQLYYDSSAASSYAGTVTGGGGLVLGADTTGSLTLSGTGNTYTGDTTVDGGSLIVSGRVGTGSTPTGDVVADNAAVLEVDGSLTAQSVTFQDSAVLAGGRYGPEIQPLQTAA